jgi:ABC-2 type transport system ATP-binding protein
MDEPANGLDPRARIEFRGFAQKLAQKGKAILIASHILADLSEICSGCIIIEKGKLVKKIEENIKGVDLENIFMEMTKGDLQ